MIIIIIILHNAHLHVAQLGHHLLIQLLSSCHHIVHLESQYNGLNRIMVKLFLDLMNSKHLDRSWDLHENMANLGWTVVWAHWLQFVDHFLEKRKWKYFKVWIILKSWKDRIWSILKTWANMKILKTWAASRFASFFDPPPPDSLCGFITIFYHYHHYSLSLSWLFIIIIII